MKFRIIKNELGYYESQVLKERYDQLYPRTEWVKIGSSHYNINDARQYCKLYKATIDTEVVEEFEL